MSATTMPELPEFPQWLWDDVLDAIHARATQEWENDRPEVADALTEVADSLAQEPPVAGLRGMH